MKRIDSIVRKALSRYPGISNCSESVDGYEHCFAFDGGPEMLEDQCLFDNVGDEDSQLPLMRLNDSERCNNRAGAFWLRDIHSASEFACASGNGNASWSSASYTWLGVRAFFLIG